MYLAPDSEVVFGDVFLRDSVYHDAHLAADAANIGAFTVTPPYRDRFIQGIEKRLNREVDAPPEGLRIYSPSIPVGHTETGLLAHGLTTHAAVLSDDCDIEEAFGRNGAAPKGRLLFAAVTEQPAKEIARIEEQEPFDRFALPSHGEWPGGVIELRRLFMVDARAVSTEPKGRGLRLGRELSTRLAVTWSAYATRRGPLAGAKSAGKFARLMMSAGVAEESALAAAEMVAQAVASAWTFEDDGLDAAAAALDEGSAPEPARQRLIETLRDLSRHSTEAADALEALSG